MSLPEGYEIREGASQMDFVAVHAWLASSYWSPDIAFDRVLKAAHGCSLVLGAFCGEQQVGYLRLISDRTTFAWLCDVFVDEGHRGKGLAKALVKFAQAHPQHQGLRRWVLATRDAHDVYKECDFEPLWEPERWMIYWPDKPPGIASPSTDRRGCPDHLRQL